MKEVSLLFIDLPSPCDPQLPLSHPHGGLVPAYAFAHAVPSSWNSLVPFIPLMLLLIASVSILTSVKQ